MAKIDERALRRMQAFDDNEDDSGSDQGPAEWESASEMESDVGEYSSDNSEEEGEEEEDDEDNDSEEESDESEEDESSEESGSDSDSNERKLKELQHNLSQIPFDKLAEIQQKVGMKAFKNTLRGQAKGEGTAKSAKYKRSADLDEDESDSDDSEDDQPNARSGRGKMDRLLAMGKEKREKKEVAKRDNKNRPMEVTSKKPVGRFRQVVEVASVKRRDPRFDNLSGKLNEDLFERSYGFIKEYQQDEMKKLRELIKKEKNYEMKEKMQRELSRMMDRQATEEAQKRAKEIKREHKRKERELISQGKKPFFLKKADQKKLALIEKFESLKDKPKALSKAMERRRKRNAAKEKTKVLGVKRRRVD